MGVLLAKSRLLGHRSGVRFDLFSFTAYLLSAAVFRGASARVWEAPAVADTRNCSRVPLASSHKHARALPGHICLSLSSAGTMEGIIEELYTEYGRVYQMMCLARREIDGSSTPPSVLADYINAGGRVNPILYRERCNAFAHTVLDINISGSALIAGLRYPNTRAVQKALRNKLKMLHPQRLSTRARPPDGSALLSRLIACEEFVKILRTYYEWAGEWLDPDFEREARRARDARGELVARPMKHTTVEELRRVTSFITK